MTAYNRHIRGETEDMLVKVHGNTVVEAGDFMFKDVTGGARGASQTADSYGYPFDLAVNSASPGTGIIAEVYTYFLGIAMESSPDGVTESISVATNGVFSYPMYSSSATTIGALVSAVSPATSSAGVSEQTVANVGAGKATTAYLGYTVLTQSATSYVDFQIRTAFGSGGLAT